MNGGKAVGNGAMGGRCTVVSLRSRREVGGLSLVGVTDGSDSRSGINLLIGWFVVVMDSFLAILDRRGFGFTLKTA